MTHTCPGCGFVSGAEARYCRMCGTPLPRVSNGSADGHDYSVSPNADTVPLGRATGDISPHDTVSPAAAPTSSRVALDFEEFRRRAEAAHAQLAEAEPPPPAAPPWPAPADLAAAHAVDDEVTTIRVRAMDEGGRASSSDALRRAADTGELAAQPPQKTAKDAGRRQQAATRAAAPGASSGNVERRALRLWLGLALFGGVVVLCVAAAVFVGWYAMRGGRVERSTAVVNDTAAPVNAAPASAPAAPAAAGDAKQQAAARLAEAEQLLASGRADEAVARLRDAAALDPAAAEPRRRLARLLLDGGSRRAAIEELRAVVHIEQNDARAWRALAQAQGAEGLHRDAAESYRRLFEVSDEARHDDRLQLSRADALLRAGRDADARAAYERLSASRVAEVARASRRQLDRLEREDENSNAAAPAAAGGDAPPPAGSRDARGPDADGREAERGRADSAPRTPEAANPDAGRESASRLSPRERYERGVRLWQSNRAAAVSDFAAAAQAGNSDANYYLGLNLVEGRDARALRRGELVAALNYFQRARRGRHSGEARRREAELGREYDRRRAAGENR